MNPSEIARQIVAQWLHRTGVSVPDAALKSLREMLGDEIYVVYFDAFRLGKHEGEINAQKLGEWVEGQKETIR